MEASSFRRVAKRGLALGLTGLLLTGEAVLGEDFLTPMTLIEQPVVRPESAESGQTPVFAEEIAFQESQPQNLPPTEVEAPRVNTPMTDSTFFTDAMFNDYQRLRRQEQLNLWGGGSLIPWDSNQIRRDTDRVGPYNQPVWTTQRPFTTARAFVLPPGQMQFEQWYRPRWLKDGSREDRVLTEFAIGLPGRFQLDIYERWNIEQDSDGHYNANHEGVQIELRWALANWGVIPFNPTTYLEWIQRSTKDGSPDKYEIKVLLADEFFDGLIFFAGNFILEQEVAGGHETELGYTQAIATTIIERKLLGGIEMWYRTANEHGSRHDHSYEFLLGPSLQFRPTNRTFLNVTGLFGTTTDAPRAEMYCIFGYQFGNRAGRNFRGINPSSLGN